MTTITFNTGRKYTVHGQRITATLHDDGVVTFWDHDRHIDGEFELGDGKYYRFTQQTVLAAYDAGDYTGTTRSSRDGMGIGGCNASHNLKSEA
jgi:hypothetical protein